MGKIGVFIDTVRKHGYKKFMFWKIISSGFRKKHPEYIKEIDYLRQRKKLAIFPYPFADEYKEEDFPAYDDPDAEMPYVIHEGKRLYLYYGWKGGTLLGVSLMYLLLRIEQHPNSPHRYFTDDFHPEKDDVLVDVGCADGMQALEWVDVVSEIWLFEYSARWIPSLQKTFEHYADKCHIVQKLVSDQNGDNTITLDDIIPRGKNIVLKLDVEGMEAKVLNGARQLIKESKRVKACVCTYHRSSDAMELTEMLSNMGLYCRFSEGYMLFTHNDDHPEPYFRKGLIRAQKYN